MMWESGSPGETAALPTDQKVGNPSERTRPDQTRITVASWGRVTLRPMAAQPVMTVEELAEALRNAPPPSEDDVTILWDGRRLDSREAVMEWLAEVEAKRAEEAAATNGSA